MGGNSSKAVVVDTNDFNGPSVTHWALPSTVFDVMMANSGHKVLNARRYFKTKKVVPMYFGDDLKANRTYFLLRVNEDGSFKEDPDLYERLKTIKKKMGRGGKNLISPVFTVQST